jgi:A/G-specific adenine glycosylase
MGIPLDKVREMPAVTSKLLRSSHYLSAFPLPHFQRKLLSWYDRHRRDLPWRQTRDPYRVWLSEIMLQQTRVAAVIEHYQEFLRRFPTVEKLATAREASVLAAWSGLGYYRRARMLHAAAKQIVREGQFPRTSARLRELPGIGRYTAAAIASIAFDEPVAVVDGNVERVLQRISGRRLTGESCWKMAAVFLDATRPGDFNQSMMELGAVVCTPRGPACLTCPVIERCATRGELHREGKLARKKKKEIHFALHCREGAVLLVQRARDASLMPGMWELPELRLDAPLAEEQAPVAKPKSRSPARLASGRNDNGKKKETPLFTLKHAITVTNYTVRVWPGGATARVAGKWVPAERLGRVALTGLARKILRKADIL